MKIWWWLCLTILTCTVGCAPGYYAPGQESIYEESGSEHLYRNPETQEQYQQRIWQEESHR